MYKRLNAHRKEIAKLIHVGKTKEVFLLAKKYSEEHDFEKTASERQKVSDTSADLQSNLLAHYKRGIDLAIMSRWSEAEDEFRQVFDANSSFENVSELYSLSILNSYELLGKKTMTEKWKWARKLYFKIERPLDEEDSVSFEKHKEEWKKLLDAFSCEMCGQCCKLTKWAVNLTTRLVWEDVERWICEKRDDILCYVLGFEGLGADLVNMQSQMFLSKCPFLVRVENGKYVCAIHETKPFVCKVAPFYSYTRISCENCRAPIEENDIYCKNCGMFLRCDPHFLLQGCPALKKALKTSEFYRSFHKYRLLEIIKMTLLLK